MTPATRSRGRRLKCLHAGRVSVRADKASRNLLTNVWLKARASSWSRTVGVFGLQSLRFGAVTLFLDGR